MQAEPDQIRRRQPDLVGKLHKLAPASRLLISEARTAKFLTADEVRRRLMRAETYLVKRHRAATVRRES